MNSNYRTQNLLVYVYTWIQKYEINQNQNKDQYSALQKMDKRIFMLTILIMTDARRHLKNSGLNEKVYLRRIKRKRGVRLICSQAHFYPGWCGTGPPWLKIISFYRSLLENLTCMVIFFVISKAQRPDLPTFFSQQFQGYIFFFLEYPSKTHIQVPQCQIGCHQFVGRAHHLW